MDASIGIVDDHPAIAVGVSVIVNAQKGMRVVATAPSVPALLMLHDRFDVVLLDLKLADGSTPAQNIELLATASTAVLAYTVGDRPQLILEAARSGAIGMIRKTELPHVIVQTIRDVLGGEPIASADWASALESESDFVSAVLTPREQEVLTLYAAGETAEQVASLLFVSRETVIEHVRRIRAKYAAAGRPSPTKIDLHRRAIEDRLLAPNE